MPSTRAQRATILENTPRQIEYVLKKHYPPHYNEMVEAFTQGLDEKIVEFINEIEDHMEAHPELANKTAV